MKKMTSFETKKTIFIFFIICCNQFMKMSSAGTVLPSANANRVAFAMDVFQNIASKNADKNFIFSPASIQTCLALAFFGADGKTAEEMRSALKLGNGEREDLAKNFGDFVKTTFKSSNHENDAQLQMANRIYVNETIDIKPEFNKLAAEHFQSNAEKVNFADGSSASKKINTWVEEQTQHKIKDLIQPDSLDGDTSAILVNAIYFKAKWAIPFSADTTQKENFAVNGKTQKPVDMMYMDETVRYADFPNLDAKALELKYNNTDLSMLLLLPNKIDGLASLEKKLIGMDLNEISSKLQDESVNVFLPKFRIEFDIDLKKPLEELGMKTMFTNAADFSRLFTTPNRVSEVKHKAYLDVNEAGSEAAAATFMKMMLMSAVYDQKTFKADHPFIFAIRSPAAVYFAGHVTTP